MGVLGLRRHPLVCAGRTWTRRRLQVLLWSRFRVLRYPWGFRGEAPATQAAHRLGRRTWSVPPEMGDCRRQGQGMGALRSHR